MRTCSSPWSGRNVARTKNAGSLLQASTTLKLCDRCSDHALSRLAQSWLHGVHAHQMTKCRTVPIRMTFLVGERAQRRVGHARRHLQLVRVGRRAHRTRPSRQSQVGDSFVRQVWNDAFVRFHIPYGSISISSE